MNVLYFLLGIVLGFFLHFWLGSKSRRRLRHLVNDLFQEKSSLDVTHVIRQEVLRLIQKAEDIQQELQIYQDLLDKTPVSYLEVDEENQLLWCNQQCKEVLSLQRWEPGQMRLLLELVRSYELDQLIENTRKFQQEQTQEWNYYSSISESEEKLRFIPVKATAYPLPKGKVGVFLENQQLAVEISQRQEQAFSDLTHELRTPLTSISLVAEALLRRTNYPEKRWVEQMLKEIKRLIDLIENWLDISYINENPHKHLNCQSLQLVDVILSAWQSLEPLAKEKSVRMEYEGPEYLYLNGDKSRLNRVFLNLLDNAIKFSPQESAILVKMIVSNTLVTVEIIDCGSGFVEQDLPIVFERLYRGDNSRTRQNLSHSNGNGLGLAIAQQIIQAHGGQIEAKNHPDTKGAQLVVKIPKKSFTAKS